MELRELIAWACKKSGLSEAEVRHNAKLKRKEFQDLISEEDSLKIVLQELGAKVEEEEPALQWNSLATIVERKVAEANVVVRLLHLHAPKNFEKERRKGTVANVEVADATGKATLVLWDEDVWQTERNGWERNDVFELRRVQVKNYNPLELHSSMLSEFVKTGERTNIPKNEQPLVPFDKLENGKEVDAAGRVGEVGELKEFERNGRKGKVLNVKLLDDSGAFVRAVLWDYYAELANRKLKVGDALKLEGFAVKAVAPGDFELSSSWRSHLIIEPRKHALQTREAVLAKTAPPVQLADYKEGVRGFSTLQLQRIETASLADGSVKLTAWVADESGERPVVFEGRQALQLIGLKQPPTLELDLVLALKEQHLKGRKLTAILNRPKSTRLPLKAEHVVKILTPLQ